VSRFAGRTTPLEHYRPGSGVARVWESRGAERLRQHNLVTREKRLPGLGRAVIYRTLQGTAAFHGLRRTCVPLQLVSNWCFAGRRGRRPLGHGPPGWPGNAELAVRSIRAGRACAPALEGVFVV